MSMTENDSDVTFETLIVKEIFSFFQLTRRDMLGRFIRYDISGRNYSTSICGRMVKLQSPKLRGKSVA